MKILYKYATVVILVYLYSAQGYTQTPASGTSHNIDIRVENGEMNYYYLGKFQEVLSEDQPSNVEYEESYVKMFRGGGGNNVAFKYNDKVDIGVYKPYFAVIYSANEGATNIADRAYSLRINITAGYQNVKLFNNIGNTIDTVFAKFGEGDYADIDNIDKEIIFESNILTRYVGIGQSAMGEDTLKIYRIIYGNGAEPAPSARSYVQEGTDLDDPAKIEITHNLRPKYDSDALEVETEKEGSESTFIRFMMDTTLRKEDGRVRFIYKSYNDIDWTPQIIVNEEEYSLSATSFPSTNGAWKTMYFDFRDDFKYFSHRVKEIKLHSPSPTISGDKFYIRALHLGDTVSYLLKTTELISLHNDISIDHTTTTISVPYATTRLGLDSLIIPAIGGSYTYSFASIDETLLVNGIDKVTSIAEDGTTQQEYNIVVLPNTDTQLSEANPDDDEIIIDESSKIIKIFPLTYDGLRSKLSLPDGGEVKIKVNGEAPEIDLTGTSQINNTDIIVSIAENPSFKAEYFIEIIPDDNTDLTSLVPEIEINSTTFTIKVPFNTIFQYLDDNLEAPLGGSYKAYLQDGATPITDPNYVMQEKDKIIATAKNETTTATYNIVVLPNTDTQLSISSTEWEDRGFNVNNNAQQVEVPFGTTISEAYKAIEPPLNGRIEIKSQNNNIYDLTNESKISETDTVISIAEDEITRKNYIIRVGFNTNAKISLIPNEGFFIIYTSDTTGNVKIPYNTLCKTLKDLLIPAQNGRYEIKDRDGIDRTDNDIIIRYDTIFAFAEDPIYTAKYSIFVSAPLLQSSTDKFVVDGVNKIIYIPLGTFYRELDLYLLILDEEEGGEIHFVDKDYKVLISGSSTQVNRGDKVIYTSSSEEIIEYNIQFTYERIPLNVYPNPSTSEIKIYLPFKRFEQYEVYNKLGINIAKGELTYLENDEEGEEKKIFKEFLILDISIYKQGVYFIRFRNKNSEKIADETVKFVKN